METRLRSAAGLLLGRIEAVAPEAEDAMDIKRLAEALMDVRELLEEGSGESTVRVILEENVGE